MRIRRKNRIFVAEHVKLACYFQAQKFRNDGTITYQGPRFSNLILDTGLDYLGSGDGKFGLVYGNCGGVNVGEGSSEPSAGQSGLDEWLAYTDHFKGDDPKGYSTDSPQHRWVREVFEFGEGECTGNLTELGMSRGEDENYFNRQLFRDENGDPTTITVLSDEGLRITVEIIAYPDMEHGDTESGDFLLNDADKIDFVREITSNNNWLTEFNGSYSQRRTLMYVHPSEVRLSDSDTDEEGGVDYDGSSLLSYSAGTFYRDKECIWDPGSFVGDIKSIFMYLNNGDGPKPFSVFRLNPAITLEDTEEFKLTVRRSWGRYEGDES